MQMALIGLLASLIGAITGALTSVWITRKQISLSRQTVKLEILQKQIERLVGISQQLAGVTVDLGQGKLDSNDFGIKKIEAFHRALRILEPFSHLFNPDRWKQLEQLAKDLDDCVMATKTGNPTKQEDFNSIYGRLDPLMAKSTADIAGLRYARQAELTRILALVK